MLKKKFVAIGHVTNDLKPVEHLGGGVSYSAVTASRLGLEAHIVTKCPKDHPYIKELKEFGITVHVLPSDKNTITTFDNQYDNLGKRRQIASQIQESISVKDQENIPWNILSNSIIVGAPVTLIDVAMELFPELAKHGSLNVIPQGYFRRIAEDGTVTQGKWGDFEKYLSVTSAVVLSDEDIKIKGVPDKDLKEKIVASAPLVALTQGAEGVTVYKKGQKSWHTGAFPLRQKELVDFTGAGDVFATAFIIEMMKNSGDIKTASVTACLFAAMKITGMGGIGIDSIPSRDQATYFLKKNDKRIKTYLKSENPDSSKHSFYMLK